MESVGDYLRRLRASKSFSLEDVHCKTGITDSALSRIENDKTQEPSPIALKKLALLYDVDNISLQIMAGYIDEDDLAQYRKIFRNIEYLNDEQKQCLQHLINIIAEKQIKG